MYQILKIIKFILGAVFGLSAISELSHLPYTGVDIHLLIAALQAGISFLFIRSALSDKNKDKSHEFPEILKEETNAALKTKTYKQWLHESHSLDQGNWNNYEHMYRAEYKQWLKDNA